MNTQDQNTNENKNLATDLFALGVDNIESVKRQADDASNPDAIAFQVSLKDGSQQVLAYSKKALRRQAWGEVAAGAKVLNVLGKTGCGNLASLTRAERDGLTVFTLMNTDGTRCGYVYRGAQLVANS